MVNYLIENIYLITNLITFQKKNLPKNELKRKVLLNCS